MTLYDYVKKLADEQGTSIHAIEVKAGLGNGVISYWQEGSPKIATLAAVAKALDVSITDILEAIEHE